MASIQDRSYTASNEETSSDSYWIVRKNGEYVSWFATIGDEDPVQRMHDTIGVLELGVESFDDEPELPWDDCFDMVCR